MTPAPPLAETVAAVRQALAKAKSPLPWKAHEMDHFGELGTGFLQGITDANGHPVDTHHDAHNGGQDFMGAHWEDGQLIVAAVNALPAVLAAYEAQQEEIAQLKAALAAKEE